MPSEQPNEPASVIDTPRTFIDLPITMYTTLHVAWVSVPRRMTVAEFDYLIEQLNTVKEALTKEQPDA